MPRQLGEQLNDAPVEGGRLLPVFRDSDELSTAADLGEVLKSALRESHALIVLCSPRSAQSRWVNEEIREFAALDRSANIHCVIVAGDPASADPAEQCFPPALKEVGLVEPLATDLRPGGEAKSVVVQRLLAGLLGVPFDQLRQREAARRQRQLVAIAAASLLGLLLTSSLAVYAWMARSDALAARNDAVEQRELAIRRSVTAERTVSFVKDLFFTSDPSEARGREITAREILERGRAQLREGLAEEPSVRTELAVTLAEVYGALGLFDEADEIVRWSFSLGNRDPAVAVRQLSVAGEARARLGDEEGSLRLARRAVALVRRFEEIAPAIRARALVELAEIHLDRDETAQARPLLREALALETQRLGNDHPHVALILEDMATLQLIEGDLEAARALNERALAIRRRHEGETSPAVSDVILALARIAWLQRDGASAERFYRSRLAIDERVLGPRHPDVAYILTSLGLVQVLQRRDYEGARAMFERAADIYAQGGAAETDAVLQLDYNRGLIYNALGQHRRADEILSAALERAEAEDHPIGGLMKVQLGHARCMVQPSRAARQLLEEARREIRSDHPEQPWYAAWADSVAGECSLRLGDSSTAARLIRTSSSAIRERWPVGTHFRAGIERRLELVRRARL